MSAENANSKQFLIADELGNSRHHMMNVLCEHALAERLRSGLGFWHAQHHAILSMLALLIAPLWNGVAKERHTAVSRLVGTNKRIFFFSKRVQKNYLKKTRVVDSYLVACSQAECDVLNVKQAQRLAKCIVTELINDAVAAVVVSRPMLNRRQAVEAVMLDLVSREATAKLYAEQRWAMISARLFVFYYLIVFHEMEMAIANVICSVLCLFVILHMKNNLIFFDIFSLMINTCTLSSHE